MSDTPDTPPTFFPEEGPASVPGVKLRAKITDTDDDDELEDLVDALNALIRKWPVSTQARAVDQATADTNGWPDDVVLGANMLGARLWRRKSTPGGVEVFGDQGIAYVRRTDPDVAMLLELGDWSKPAVG